MNDYKELIQSLRMYQSLYDEDFECVEQRAANALEEVINERDGLLFILKRYILPLSPEACEFCVHHEAEPHSQEFKDNCDECMNAQHFCCWEYGGIPKKMLSLFG